jgi:hypothetical protein
LSEKGRTLEEEWEIIEEQQGFIIELQEHLDRNLKVIAQCLERIRGLERENSRLRIRTRGKTQVFA